MTQDKPIVETISNAGEQVTNVFGQFWQLVTSKNTTNNGDSKPIKIEQLPIYAEDNAPLKQKFLPEEPLPLQREFATIRIACEQEYDRVAVSFTRFYVEKKLYFVFNWFFFKRRVWIILFS